MASGGFGAFITLAPAAHAASDYSHAQYQITLSLNCNHPATVACANFVGLGGEWGWIALNGSPAGGTGNAQITGCGHVPGQGSGAGHESYDPAWQLLTGVTQTPFLTGGPVDPANPLLAPTDPNGNYLSIAPSPDGGVPPFTVPATFGHYSISWDGASGQITVAP